MDRVAEARTLVADHARTPELADAERVFLAGTLDRMRRAVSESGRPEQLLHDDCWGLCLCPNPVYRLRRDSMVSYEQRPAEIRHRP
ncbi:hypothetical protein [Micromonospora sp. A202]|uniref:hypothetical protein n=1 Tax=Micromonospora sp. A202 TaxID=2572899 RepID=UPI00163A5AC5|nr:hypothetical protein [Micromonospora sp. A202]